MIPEFKLRPGPVKWCKTCGREHKARADCGLVEVERIAKSGRTVKRWAQPAPEPVKKSHSRRRVRKS